MAIRSGQSVLETENTSFISRKRKWSEIEPWLLLDVNRKSYIGCLSFAVADGIVYSPERTEWPSAGHIVLPPSGDRPIGCLGVVLLGSLGLLFVCSFPATVYRPTVLLFAYQMLLMMIVSPSYDRKRHLHRLRSVSRKLVPFWDASTTVGSVNNWLNWSAA